VLAILVFHGCAGIYSVVDFEILEPANVNFPDYVHRLIIMDRAPVTLDAFKEEDRGGITPDELYILDTIISYNLIRGVYEMFLQSPAERFSDPAIINERRTDTADMGDLILTKREVASLCQEYGGDAIISLEFYSLDINQTKIPDRPDEEELLTHYYTVSNEIHWNIYLPESPRPFDTYKTIDTIYFTDFLDGFFQPIPDVPGMIRELSLESGRKYGRYLVPVWTLASRQLFKGKGDSLKKASRYTDMGDWDSAFEIWNELIRSQDSTVVARAYHNMAIYYELEDKLESADLLVGMALKYDTLETIRNYKEELETRLLNRKEILEQVE
jgi:tetratricopeptide (TPR) repeat protein